MDYGEIGYWFRLNGPLWVWSVYERKHILHLYESCDGVDGLWLD